MQGQSGGTGTEATDSAAGAKLKTSREFKPEEQGTLHPRKPPELAQHIMSNWKAQHGDGRSQGRERSPSPHHAEQEFSQSQGGNTRQTGKICLYLTQLTPLEVGNVSGWASSSNPVGWGAGGGVSQEGQRLSSTNCKALSMGASAPTGKPHGDASRCITQPWADSESPAAASGRRVSVRG